MSDYIDKIRSELEVINYLLQIYIFSIELVYKINNGFKHHKLTL